MSGCEQSSTPQPLEFELLTKSGLGPPPSMSSGTDALAYRVFADSESWARFSKSAFRDSVPAVSFDDAFVLCVYQGEKSTGGYAIAVEDVQWVEGGLRVVLNLTEPRPGDMLIQVITDPFAVYRVKKPSGAPDAAALDDVRLSFVRRSDAGEVPVQARKLNLP